MGAMTTPQSTTSAMGSRASGYSVNTSTTMATTRKRHADTAPATPPPGKSARRRVDSSRANAGTLAQGPVEVIDLTGDDTSPGKPKKEKSGVPERRAKPFRKQAPNLCLDRLGRARTQRMFVVGHTTTWVDGFPVMEFDMAGTTGNLYKVTVGKVPVCNCPDGRKGNQCKHIFYVLVNALKAPAHLQYQLAFLSTELCGIYQGSPLNRQQTNPDDETAGNRKPIEGDCPICFMEFEPDKEEIVWCRAACGNNVHKECFSKWASMQRAQGVRCVYCRSEWQADSKGLTVAQLQRNGQVNDEGYVNVADQLGLSGHRDSSSYYRPWDSRGSYYYGQRNRGWREYGSWPRRY